VRVAAKDIVSLLLDEERLRNEGSDRSLWRSRVTGIEEPSVYQHVPRTRADIQNEEDEGHSDNKDEFVENGNQGNHLRDTQPSDNAPDDFVSNKNVATELRHS
jgi:epsin